MAEKFLDSMRTEGFATAIGGTWTVTILAYSEYRLSG
jgi:hypothetical protein